MPALAEEGTDTRLIQDYLGHRSIANTVVYTETSAKRLASDTGAIGDAAPDALLRPRRPPGRASVGSPVPPASPTTPSGTKSNAPTRSPQTLPPSMPSASCTAGYPRCRAAGPPPQPCHPVGDMAKPIVAMVHRSRELLAQITRLRLEAKEQAREEWLQRAKAQAARIASRPVCNIPQKDQESDKLPC